VHYPGTENTFEKRYPLMLGENHLLTAFERVSVGPLVFEGEAASDPRDSILVVHDRTNAAAQRAAFHEVIGDAKRASDIDWVALTHERIPKTKSCGRYRGPNGTREVVLNNYGLFVQLFDRRTGKLLVETTFVEPSRCPDAVTLGDLTDDPQVFTGNTAAKTWLAKARVELAAGRPAPKP